MTITTDDARQEVDAALDTARRHLGVETDAELAERLGVSRKQISFWRNGRWTSGDKALIWALVNRDKPLPAAA